MISSTGKRISPLRAFQYSSALDTHDYVGNPNPQNEIIKINKQLKQKDSDLMELKRSFLEVTSKQKPLKNVTKNITFSYSNSNSKSGSPQKDYFSSRFLVNEHAIKLPNPRFNDFNPITGLNRNIERSYSPFQNIGKQLVDNSYGHRPLFN
ncbi:hypothetical protein SteCoe_11936 [Stentor coeruleus]|uniref:Uncharacterized protein n=1 Tax=Stentor coeruleus TaxID=5963 RepID=A0A1R2CBZ2_9CILI|nr:hypothetical protein SteCoe_11936 [Stentor coeruleus]